MIARCSRCGIWAMNMKTSISLEFKSEPVLLKSVRALTEQYLCTVSLAQEKRQEIVLAVDEACTNAIRHAYQGSPDETIRLLLRKNDSCLEIVVADWGNPMPSAVSGKEETMQTKTTPESVRPGGLGLKLIRQVFDDLHITTGKQQGNRIRMRLFFK